MLVRKALVDAIGQEGDERGPVAFEVEEADGFGVAFEPGPVRHVQRDCGPGSISTNSPQLPSFSVGN